MVICAPASLAASSLRRRRHRFALSEFCLLRISRRNSAGAPRTEVGSCSGATDGVDVATEGSVEVAAVVVVVVVVVVVAAAAAAAAVAVVIVRVMVIDG